MQRPLAQSVVMTAQAPSPKPFECDEWPLLWVVAWIAVKKDRQQFQKFLKLANSLEGQAGFSKGFVSQSGEIIGLENSISFAEVQKQIITAAKAGLISVQGRATGLSDLGTIDRAAWKHIEIDPRFLTLRVNQNVLFYNSISQWTEIEFSCFEILRQWPPKSESSAAISKSPKFSKAQVEAVYIQYVESWPAEAAPPTREDDLQAMQQKFGQGVSNPVIRDLRRRFAPIEWRKSGRRKSKR
jgi:hypothetical protein